MTKLSDISDVQREKIRPLVETITLDTEDDFRTKIKSVKESVLNSKPTKTKVITEMEESKENIVTMNPVMESYVTALKRNK